MSRIAESAPTTSDLPSPVSSPRILVVGLTAGGRDGLTSRSMARISAADLLVGGRRHLSYFPEFSGETVAIAADMEQIVQRLLQAQAKGEKAVVLASGDPLCYGIGSTLRRAFSADALEIIPAPTAYQLAFAALGEPWHDAALLSAHARPLDVVVQGVLAAPKAAILTDNQQTPWVIAQALLAAGLLASSQCAICENLGGSEERIVRTTLDEVEANYAALNVFVVWNHTNHKSRITPGLPDDALTTSANQITKREVRLLALAELALRPHEVLWDIGAGSGSVSIEAARAVPNAQVYAVEKRAELLEHMEENVRRFPASNLQVHQGIAPDACAEWPRPDAIFVGGSGGQLDAIVQTAKERLSTGGRLVLNLATIDNLQAARQLLPDATINQVQISRGVPIQEMLRFQAMNPVFMVTWVRT